MPLIQRVTLRMLVIVAATLSGLGASVFDSAVIRRLTSTAGAAGELHSRYAATISMSHVPELEGPAVPSSARGWRLRGGICESATPLSL